MVVSLRSSHTFRIPVVWHDVAVVRELFVADDALPVLVDNFPVQLFPHFGWRSEFPISPRVMSVVNSLDAEP
jgi:hypothetical protein